MRRATLAGSDLFLWLFAILAGTSPFLALALVAGPIAEEVLFRGLFGAIFAHAWVFLLVSSILDAALHIDPLNFLPLLWMWLVLGYIRRRWDSIYPTIAIHILFNGVALALHFFS